jgi:hypothetical protein
MSRAGRDHPLGAQLPRELVADVLEAAQVSAGGDETPDARVAQHVERDPRLAGEAAAVRAANPSHDILGERLALDDGRAGEREELAQDPRVGGGAVAEHGVAHALETGDVGIAPVEVQRRLDDRQRADLLRPSGGGDERSERAVGVRDDVRARVEQREQILAIDLEVLAPVRRLGAGADTRGGARRRA